MRYIFVIILSFFLIGSLPADSYSWERYDGVAATVNNIPIIESDLNSKVVLHQKKNMTSARNIINEKSRILDKMIEDALVLEASRDQSIVINDARVLSQLEKFMKGFFVKNSDDDANLDELIPKLIDRLELKLANKKLKQNPELDKDLDRFVQYVENSQKMDFLSFFEELRLNIRREQVMSIAIGVTPPGKSEVEDWYRKNTAKIGYEVRIKHILIRPKGTSLTAESEANNVLNDLRQKIFSGASFESLAQKYSQDPATAYKGGDLGWVWLAELDPYFAGTVFKMSGINEISRVFKSGGGYHIVKYLGKRPVPFEKVENMIMYKLYTERMYSQFQKWVDKRRGESEIKIYLSDYIKG